MRHSNRLPNLHDQSLFMHLFSEIAANSLIANANAEEQSFKRS